MHRIYEGITRDIHCNNNQATLFCLRTTSLNILMVMILGDMNNFLRNFLGWDLWFAEIHLVDIIGIKFCRAEL